MVDKITQEARSYNMSRVKGKDTKPELLIRKFLHSNGFRYRLHDKRLPGKPDIVLPKYKTVIFINGCFWHGHENCNRSSIPKTRTEWWASKIKKNIGNDQKVWEYLKNQAWNVIIVWTCKLRPSLLNHTLEEIKQDISRNTND